MTKMMITMIRMKMKIEVLRIIYNNDDNGIQDDNCVDVERE